MGVRPSNARCRCCSLFSPPSFLARLFFFSVASAHPWRVDHESPAKHFVAFLTRLGSPLLDNRAPHRGIITSWTVMTDKQRNGGWRIDGFGGWSIDRKSLFRKWIELYGLWIIRIVSIFIFIFFFELCRSLFESVPI